MRALIFKGYQGSIEHDHERSTYRGKLQSIDDLVTYEAATEAQLRPAFEAAVGDYIETCRELGREPRRPTEQEPEQLKQH